MPSHKHEASCKHEGNINCRWWGHLDVSSCNMGVGVETAGDGDP